MSEGIAPGKKRHPHEANAARLLCLLATLAAWPLPFAWRHWKYSRPLELPAAASRRLVSLALPHDMYAHAGPGLADLRVMDESGAEVPYVLRTRDQNGQTIPPFPAVILENSFSPGNYTQLVLDLADDRAFHNSVRIETPAAQFLEWIRIDTSDDARIWRIVQERAPIFRFSRKGRAGTNVVRFSPNNARFLRVRILDGRKRFEVTRVEIAASPAVPPEREPLEVKPLPAKPDSPGQSAWSADLGAANAPMREVRFEVGAQDFVREVTVRSSGDGAQWFGVGGGEIYRFTQENHKCEDLSVPINRAPERYLRVAIANGNDEPLTGAVPTIYLAAQQVTFEQKPGSSYRLLYGQSEAKPAHYDLARRLSQPQIDAAVAAEAGREEINTNWSDPRPWSETHSFVVWIGVGLVVLLLGYTAMQSLRRSSSSNSQ
jgi:Protein of unknown function (DUF3999)